MTTITVNAPATVNAPRGAHWAGVWFAALLNGLEKSGSRRVDRSDQANRLAEAARVRLHAQQVMQHDPRVAADLFAAADRHEQG